MKEIFDKYIETSFDGFAQAEFKFKQFEYNYKKYFSPVPSSKILDIGVGRGEMLSCMRDWGYAYHGIDISESTIKYCKSRKLNCEIVRDTAEWLTDNQVKYDLITCLDVVEHVPRDKVIDFLSAIHSNLSDGGKAIIQVPNLQSPYGYLHHFNDFTHVSGFVEHSLAQVLIASGFTRFTFSGFEELVFDGYKQNILKGLRSSYWLFVRFLRRINNNPNPKILNPVFFAVAEK